MIPASEFREIADQVNIDANATILADIEKEIEKAANNGQYDVRLEKYEINDLSAWLRDYFRQHGYELIFDYAGRVKISWK